MGKYKCATDWKEHEAKICLMFIKKNPDNLQHAFRLAGREIGRTSGAVQQQYYKKDGAIYRLARKRHIFGIYNISTFLGNIISGKFFGKQVKNNMPKGKLSL